MRNEKKALPTTQAVSLRVTFVIPAYNVQTEVMKESFQSIQQQTFRNFEAIVVDESSDPICAAACKALCEEDPRFIYLRPTNRLGLAGSLNYAIDQARGEFIARFDSDDICLPDRISEQIKFLDSNPIVGVLGGWMEIISDDSATVTSRRYPEYNRDICRGIQTTTTIAHPTVMFRKSLMDKYSAYNATYRFSEDLELWLRWMNSDVVFHNLPKVLVQYRQSSTQRSPKHWRFNVRARVRNFSTKYFLRRCMGLMGIIAWIIVPDSIQELIYHHFIFSIKNVKG